MKITERQGDTMRRHAVVGEDRRSELRQAMTRILDAVQVFDIAEREQVRRGPQVACTEIDTDSVHPTPKAHARPLHARPQLLWEGVPGEVRFHSREVSVENPERLLALLLLVVPVVG